MNDSLASDPLDAATAGPRASGSSGSSGQPPAPPAKPRRSLAGRLLRWLLMALLVLVLLAGALMVWLRSEGSLPRALQLAQRFLPAGHSLSYEGAHGAITRGGQIQRLQWRNAGTALEVEGLQLDWNLWELLDRALHVQTLKADRVHVQIQPSSEPPPPSEPFVMPQRLALPVRIGLPVQVGRLEIEMLPAKEESQDENKNKNEEENKEASAPAIHVLENLDAHYGYDGQWHALQLRSLHYGEHRAQGDVRLHGGNLNLQARVGAWLGALTEVPGAEGLPALQALLQADGTLAGGDAALVKVDLAAHEMPPGSAAAADLLQALQTGDGEKTAEKTEEKDEAKTEKTALSETLAATLAATRLRAQAALHPWRAQPVQEARVDVFDLNAHSFHPAAPPTQLAGHLEIRPDADNASGGALAEAAWQLQAQLDNHRPGLWPLESGAPADGKAENGSAINGKNGKNGNGKTAKAAKAAAPTGLPVRSLKANIHYAPARDGHNAALRIEQTEIALEGAEPAGRLVLEGQLLPEQLAQSAVQLQIHALDLQRLTTSPDLPGTDLSGSVHVKPADSTPPEAQADLAQAHWDVQADLRNARPGFVDQARLPLGLLQAQAHIAPERITLSDTRLIIGQLRASDAASAKPHLQLQGHFEPATQALHVEAALQQLPLVQLHSQLTGDQAPPDLSGTLLAQGDLSAGVDFEANISSDGTSTGASTGTAKASSRSRWDVRAIQTKGRWQPDLLALERLHLDAFAAKVDADTLRVSLPDARKIDAALKASAPGLQLSADAAMQADSGGGKLALQLASAQEVVNWLRGLPSMEAPLAGLQASGSAQLDASWQGGWQQWLDGLQKPAAFPQLRVDAQARSSGLKIVLPGAQPAPKTASNTASKAQSKAAQQQAEANTIDVRQLDARLQGNLAAADLSVSGDVLASGTRAQLEARAHMAQAAKSTAAAPQWDITLAQLNTSATLPEQQQPWQLRVDEGLRIQLQTGKTLQITSTAGQARLTPPASVTRGTGSDALTLRWEPLRFAQNEAGAIQLQSRGQLSGLVLTWLDGLSPDNPPLANAGVRSTLALDGQWDVDLGPQAPRISAELKRTGGEIWLGQSVQGSGKVEDAKAAGIRNLALRLQTSGQNLQANLAWEAQRAGTIDAQAQTTLSQQGGGWTLAPNAPLSGQVRAQLPDLGVWGSLAPLGWRIAGALDANIQLGGTLDAPRLQGPITATGLNLRSVLDGVDLHGGSLRAQLQGERLIIEELVFQGGTGSNAYVRGLSGNRTPAPTERGRMVASGTIGWGSQGGSNGVAMDVKAQLEAMQALVRNDRQISLSGPLSASLQDGALRVRGDIRIDRASITLPESGAPVLGDDVVVVRASDPPKEEEKLPRGELQTAKPMDLEIKLDLGRDFALQGYGITSRLEGALTIRNATRGDAPIVITGEIRTDEGRYRAWGQALNVETGVVRFNGPYDNPSINLLAVRPDIDVRAGVRVTGTAQAPRVALYSEPSLPESETLSWVIMGRAPGSGADGNAMQQAAIGLLAGSVGGGLAQGLGLDEVGMSDSGVSVGKRLSDQLYVTYVASLSGAAGTLYVFYDITRRLTARGETGATSAVDLIYTMTYD